VQGAAGMVMYEPKVLEELIKCCKENDILTIADEVMTGFGRTGKFFATDFLNEKPDIVCMSKGLTGGTMALGATSCTQEIYDAFLSGDKNKTFFHGHSYTANPIACAASIAALTIYQKSNLIEKSQKKIAYFRKATESLADGNPLKNFRTLGFVAAFSPLSFLMMSSGVGRSAA